jgi:hypothetical protein
LGKPALPFGGFVPFGPRSTSGGESIAFKQINCFFLLLFDVERPGVAYSSGTFVPSFALRTIDSLTSVAM